VPESLTQIGKYHLESELGRGGMGVVYKAFDPVVERTVAIKTIRLDVENPGDLVERLRREAKSVGQLEHPNIVTLYDAGEAEGWFYLAMQFIQGETLQQRINRQKWFNWKEAHDLMQQICAGLGYAHHRGIVHRDIKPANIMITPEGVVKLTDFGIAKLVDTGTSSSGMVVGTPSYMSPEQALGKPVDARSDIFSLGSILYELTTSEKAFPGQNATTVIYKIVHESPVPITALQPGLNPALDAIVLRALAKSPEQRFSTCLQLAQALDSYTADMAAAMRKTTLMPSPFASQIPTAPEPPVSFVPVMPAAPSTGTLTPPVALPPAAPMPESGPPAAEKPRSPLVWLGAGALGAVLIVVVVLLSLRAQRPASNPETAAPAGVTTSAPGTSATELPAAQSQQGAGEAIQQPASGPAQPAPSSPSRLASPLEAVPTIVRKQTPARTPRREEPSERRPVASRETGASNRLGAAASATQPQTYDALIVAGDMAFQQGQYQQALEAYKKAYAVNPQSGEAKQKIVVALTLLGRPEEARKYQ
jgi:eukaryotic-like serine/threonine-protein kinase